MRDVRIAELAGRQFNRVSRAQLIGLGLSASAITYLVSTGQLAIVEQAVYAIAPVLEHDEWGRWMGATLTAPGSALSQTSGAAAYGFWSLPRPVETVDPPGQRRSATPWGRARLSEHLLGSPTRHSCVASRSRRCRGLFSVLPRWVSDRALARAVREAVRLELTSVGALGDALGSYYGRRGSGRLAATVARYTGLPLERARSGAEIRAMEVLRDAGRPVPRLNVRIGGEEADLVWLGPRLIVEIDGGPFHLDVGEDARRQAAWQRAGWTVRRLPSDDVYERPHRLLQLAPPPNVPQ